MLQAPCTVQKEKNRSKINELEPSQKLTKSWKIHPTKMKGRNDKEK